MTQLSDVPASAARSRECCQNSREPVREPVKRHLTPRDSLKKGAREPERATRARCALDQAVHLQVGVQLVPGWHLHAAAHLQAAPHVQAGPQPQDSGLVSVARPVAGEFESTPLAVEFI